MSFNARFLLTALVLAGTAILLQAARSQEDVQPRQSFVSFPREINDWQGIDLSIAPEVLRVLGPGDFLSRNYRQRSSNSPPVNLFVAYFPSQRAGDTIHSPKHCLPGSGWFPIESERVRLSLHGLGIIPVNRYLVAKGDDRDLVIYWYWAHGRALASEYSAKLYLVADSMTMNRSDGSLIRILTALRPGESLDAAQSRIQSFAGDLFPLMNTFVPQ